MPVDRTLNLMSEEFLPLSRAKKEPRFDIFRGQSLF